MEYEDGYYLKEDYKVGNSFDDDENQGRILHKEIFSEWKKELVGDRVFLKILSDKIVESWDKVSGERKYINELSARVVTQSGEEREWTEWAIHRGVDRRTSYEKDLNNWKFKKEFYLGKVSETNSLELNIESAKEVPIDRIVGEIGVGTSKRKFFKCPLHEERSASLCWFVEENRFKCFGCGEGGDSIDLYKKLNDCDFRTAVKQLNRF